MNTPLFHRILANTPFSENEFRILVATAPRRYKDHYIDKRRGGRRLISQPTAELKFLQRLLVKHELCNLPLHDAAVAYRINHSIKDHAKIHAASRYLLKLDFRDFFSSLTEQTIRHRLSIDANYSEEELWVLCHLLCRQPFKGDQTLRLSIGAPSSPFVSNYLMWEFDVRLTEICAKNNAIYTRYADDLAISTSLPHALDIIKDEVIQLLSELSYLGLTLNNEKTVNVSKKNRRTLVGLNLANDGSTSIGREKKRLLRAQMHALTCGRLLPETLPRLQGMLAFTYAIDPDFVMGLCRRYGFSRISEVGFFQNNNTTTST
ncbi:MAG: retron St85 family RNA-directed DNA polymerase [Gallionella sp.]|nr:retron St85 family RNA-directed DNA polymerase [Gallionella sp.]